MADVEDELIALFHPSEQTGVSEEEAYVRLPLPMESDSHRTETHKVLQENTSSVLQSADWDFSDAPAKTVTPDDLPSNIGLVITSPPYPNAYEYWLYHKYRMYWLDMDPISVREHEIGARPHYFKKNPQNEQDFERQMGVCFHLLSQVMKPGAKACFLVGRSIIRGKVIDNAALLQRSAQSHGFVTEGMVERSIPSTRKTFNPSHGKINQEHLIVFALQR